ncbi:MAG: FKBP-type peptidyl-prolyl cis-trans isomerase [Planctomycetota bacterium]
MKKVLLHALMCGLLAVATSRAEDAPKPVVPVAPATPAKDAPKLDLKTDKDIASYALGLNYGSGAKAFVAELDIDALANSLRDTVNGKESKLSDEVLGAALGKFSKFMQAKQGGDDKAKLDDKVNVSIALGKNVGTRLADIASSLNVDLMVTAFITGTKGETGGFDLNANRPVVEKYFKTLSDEMMAKQKEAGVKNQKESDDFFADNKKKEGVVTTPSGLQYKVLTAGKGDMPKVGDRVSVNYEGRFLDGKVFDSTKKHGQPFDTDLEHLIPGWIEALKLMQIGSKYELYVPANLAYGENGQPPSIPASKMLIFTMELLSIKKGEAPAAPVIPPVVPVEKK